MPPDSVNLGTSRTETGKILSVPNPPSRMGYIRTKARETRMSPLQIGALVSGIIFGAVRVMCCVMELVAQQTLVPDQINVLINICTTVSWIAFFSAFQCERFMARLNTMEAGLHRDIPGYGELCTQDGRNDASREHARATQYVGVQRGRTLAPVE